MEIKIVTIICVTFLILFLIITAAEVAKARLNCVSQSQTVDIALLCK